MKLRIIIRGLGVSGNHRNGYNRRTATTYKTRDAAAYEAACGVSIQMAIAMTKPRWQTVRWCAVDVVIFNTIMDMDNRLKPVFDALQRAGAIENDKYIVRQGVDKKWDSRDARVEVEIESIDPQAWGIPADIIARADAAKRPVPRVRARAQASAPKVPKALLDRALALSRMRT